jgi:hypothetical protein
MRHTYIVSLNVHLTEFYTKQKKPARNAQNYNASSPCRDRQMFEWDGYERMDEMDGMDKNTMPYHRATTAKCPEWMNERMDGQKC